MYQMNGTGDFVASRVNLYDKSILVSFVLLGQPGMCEIPIPSLSQRIHMLFVYFLFTSTCSKCPKMHSKMFLMET